MNVNEIRKLVKQRPFKPFIFHLDNGEAHPVVHPEIVVGNEIIVAIDEDGKSIMIAPEAVSSIEFSQTEPVTPGDKNA
jgi:hypothetical protein